MTWNPSMFVTFAEAEQCFIKGNPTFRSDYKALADNVSRNESFQMVIQQLSSRHCDEGHINYFLLAMERYH
jgi:hypothetical protein